MEYQLVDPPIGTIIDYCNDLLSGEKLIVFDERENFVLHIYKDEDYDPYVDEDAYNIVTISVFKNGKCIEDTDDIYVTDGELEKELTRIYCGI